MSRIFQWTALLAVVALLIGVLILLIGLTRNGIDIHYAGELQVAGMPQEIALRMAEPVDLQMPGGTQMTASISQGETIPLTITLVPCPECGGTMLPVKWNPWSGTIEWGCPQCGATVSRKP